MLWEPMRMPRRDRFAIVTSVGVACSDERAADVLGERSADVLNDCLRSSVPACREGLVNARQGRRPDARPRCGVRHAGGGCGGHAEGGCGGHAEGGCASMTPSV